LSLKIYLDDCICAKVLIAMLRAEGHDVLACDQAGFAGASDQSHLQRAAADDRVLITTDAEDFANLHSLQPGHSGIFAIHMDNDPLKDMSFADIVRSIRNIEQAGVAIRGQFWSLNAWRY
jgi:predicted nuclease of predicted toxin-antitoxin system